MSNESIGLLRLTACPMHVPSRDKKGVDMMAHVDDQFVVGCLKDVQDVYHDSAALFEIK